MLLRLTEKKQLEEPLTVCILCYTVFSLIIPWKRMTGWKSNTNKSDSQMKTDVIKFLSCLCSKKNKHNQKRAKKELCIKRTIKRSPHKEKRESGYFKKATNKNSPLTKNSTRFFILFHQPFFQASHFKKSHLKM